MEPIHLLVAFDADFLFGPRPTNQEPSLKRIDAWQRIRNEQSSNAVQFIHYTTGRVPSLFKHGKPAWLRKSDSFEFWIATIYILIPLQAKSSRRKAADTNKMVSVPASHG